MFVDCWSTTMGRTLEYVCMSVSMYLCMYEYVYMNMYVSMYVCIYVRMYVCMYVCMYDYVYMNMYVCLYLCIYVSCIKSSLSSKSRPKSHWTGQTFSPVFLSNGQSSATVF